MSLISATLQGIGKTGANIGDVINVGFAYSDYSNAREQGDSMAVSLGKAAGTFAWGEFFYGGLSRATGKALGKIGIKGLAGGAIGIGVSIGASLIMSGGQLVQAIGENNKPVTQAYRRAGKFGSGYFEMSQAGYTMRQRSLNAIRSNGLNTQSVLGNEARTYYRGSV